MALREYFETALPDEIQSPEIFVPFSPEDISALRVHILIASGAFSRMDITEQLKAEANNSLISKFVTVKLAPNKQVDVEQVVASLERPQIERANTLSTGAIFQVPFFDFINGIFDVNQRIEEIDSLSDGGAMKMSAEIRCIFADDDILVALKAKLDSGSVPTNEIISYQRAIQAQETVLIALNYEPKIS